MTYELSFDGPVPSKKNAQLQGTAKSGKKYRYYAKGVQKAMSDLEMQVPGELRDLRLEHPKAELFLTAPVDTIDVDGVWTCLVDVLKKQGVITDDNLKHFNGGVYLAPAVISDHWLTVVKLTEAE